MSRANLYFNDPEAEMCFPIDQHKIFMSMNGEDERVLYEAKRQTGVEFFFCNEFCEVGLVGEGCGKICPSYKPRNGKNGRCRHSGHCYEATEKTMTIHLDEQV